MKLKNAVGSGVLALLLTGCAGGVASNSATPVAPPSPSTSASAGGSEPQAAQIQWLDGSMTYADPDAGTKVFNFFNLVGMATAPKVKYDALISDAKATEKDGQITYTLTIDEVTRSSAGGEEGPGYVNPDKKTRQVSAVDPLILVNPPNVVTPTSGDFVGHLKEFDEPFSFYYDGKELIAVVEWYHP
jgi:hypothetical protein